MLCSPPGAREEQVYRTVLVIVAAWPCLFLAPWIFKSTLARSAKRKNAVLRSESILGNSEHSFGLRLIAGEPFIFSEKEIGPIFSSIRRTAAENKSLFHSVPCLQRLLQFICVLRWFCFLFPSLRWSLSAKVAFSAFLLCPSCLLSFIF